MKTYYFVDFENVHDEGLEKIQSLSGEDKVHIFYTQNTPKIEMEHAFSKIPTEAHKVSEGKQSLDMHLVSFLGYVLGASGKECSYVIISKDTDYDKVIDFWKTEGYSVSRLSKIPDKSKKTKQSASNTNKIKQASNEGIAAGVNHDFSGEDRKKLNEFMQKGLSKKGYEGKYINTISKCVIDHCNDERRLNEIHNDLREQYDDYDIVYKDIKALLNEFKNSENKTAKREAQVRSFFGQHFRKKIYVEKKEEIINIIINAKTKQQVKKEFSKLYKSDIANHIFQTVQPLLKDL